MCLPSERRKRDRGAKFGPGLIYDLFYRKRQRKEEEKETPDYQKFVDMCIQTYRKVGKTKKINVSKDLRDAIEFLGWELPPEAVVVTAQQYAVYGALAGAILSIFMLYGLGYIGFPPSMDMLYSFLNFLSMDPMLWVILAFPLVFGVVVYYSIISYPVSVARSTFQRDLLPSLRVVGNIVLSMKLVPNLEKAIAFSVEHGEGFLAEMLKQLLWDLQLGMYASAEEGLDKVAYRIGRYSDEFKHAMMRIRTSLLEADDAKRYVLLDGALREVVDGVKNRMVAAASSLYSPSIQLFYLGVFLPLLLFIVIPVWSAFSPNNPFGNPIVVVIVYNVVLPAATYYFAKSILSKRPQAYTAPEIPDRLVKNFEIKRRNAILSAIAIFIITMGVAYYLHILLDNSVEKILVSAGVCPVDAVRSCMESMTQEEIEYYTQGIDLTPYSLIFGSLLAVTLAIAYYLYTITQDKLRIQQEVMEIEREFKDAVYVLASRMGEGKPLESALDAVSENMPESKIASVFERISYNVKQLGLTIEEAIFSPVFGVLRDLPSKRLHDAMRLVVAATSLGTELASRALAALSEQLRNEETVVQRIREKTGEIAAMMFAMAYFVGPIVMGITVALEKVIVSSVASVTIPEGQTEALSELGLGGVQLPTGLESKGPALPDWVFIATVGVYTLEITALLVWFATYLHDGPNRVTLYRKLAIALVVAAVLFIASAWVSVSLVQGMM